MNNIVREQIQNQKLKAILLKPHEERSESEIEKLVQLIEKISIDREVLTNFAQEDLKGLTKHLKYEKHQKGTILIPWGDNKK